MIASSEYKNMVAFFVLEAIKSGETEQAAITSSVQERIPWATADDVVDAAHHVLDICAQAHVERGSEERKA